VIEIKTPAPADKQPPARAGLSFMGLRPGTCRYPLGGPTEPALRYCGAPTPLGSPYCLACAKIAYRAAPPRR
jgi:GcrA cell cycle regulator